MNAIDRGRHDVARRYLARAIEVLERSTGMAMELDLARMLDQVAAYWNGEFAEIARTLPVQVDEAAQRGRILGMAWLSSYPSVAAWLTHDDVDGYQRQLDSVKEGWTREEPGSVPHLLVALSGVLLDLYRGEPTRAFQSFDAQRAAFTRSGANLGPIGSFLFEMASAFGAASAYRVERRGAYLASARAGAKRLVHLPTERARALGHVVQASLALAHGNPDGARRALDQALQEAVRGGCRMVEAGIRIRLGELVGGDEGGALIGAGRAIMQRQGVVNVERLTEVLCPGCAMVS
jgi:hypothetical protein